MLKIWGRVNSVNVKKALWAAEELGLNYERVNAGMEHGVTKTPEYLKMNPNSLVPTIDDDGFIFRYSGVLVTPCSMPALTRKYLKMNPNSLVPTIEFGFIF